MRKGYRKGIKVELKGKGRGKGKRRKWDRESVRESRKKEKGEMGMKMGKGKEKGKAKKIDASSKITISPLSLTRTGLSSASFMRNSTNPHFFNLCGLLSTEALKNNTK